ncbi:Xanthine dehydrogenase [Clostridium sp. DL-VIII]|uniref:xanthine dehydrogenase family protein molybdopterin-binding subunit n=1 Tax=Clostridium sp. DL-VIII TaxID=641107 RepID=UPI00023AF362|nr:molybdopterin cofactor-binding domain-containing protein [Clostridium sp. DL-VIII]EHI97740.1 Xanthine dehydrogenase [Clostridium sp. DL-VIII]
MSFVNKGIRKKDAMSLVTGKPVYTDDIAPSNCLIVKVLRSPHAHASVEDINIEIANKVPGIECILTYKDVPKSRFTMAGQSYPEPSPYDRLILDKKIRCVGDPVAIVAGIDNKCVDKALKLIKVKYEVLDAILDFREAKDNKILVHPEEDFKVLCDVGANAKRNICSCDELEIGNVEQELSKCDYVIEQTYHTKANSQAMMETFRTFTELDTYGRLNITSSTQIPFHVRRILSNALEIPKSKIRVIKPRIGGGFGAKQSVVAEIFPAMVTLKTGKPAKMIFTRKESMTNGSPRHEMEIKVRLGADKNGVIKAIDVYTLSNAGAYGEHGPTTVGLSGHKSMPLYGKVNAYRFNFDVVYSNTMGGGAYRGYGATQGIFALESAVNELAAKLNMDPIKIREINMVKEGQVMPAYYNETANSCALDKCLEKAKEMIDWDKKYPCRDMENGKVRSVGVAMAMQGSGISNVDTAAVEIKLNDDGFYTLMIGASEMGMGCDTILAQMAADCLDCAIDNIIVHGVDTDQSPYDTGSYASSTTYITGGAVVKTCETLRKKIIEESSKLLNCLAENLDFDGEKIFSLEDNKSITLKELANATYIAGSSMLSASESNSSLISPPPFMVGIVETEIDKLTGKLEIIDYVAVVDCGTVINPNLARIQTEGGIVQGIGMALYEDITYDKNGRMRNDSFLQYKIPTRLDVGNIRVEFESSFEPTGPFGAKSIGEIVINTPSPALANAVYNATKVNIRTLPITAEKIVMGMLEK